MLTPARVNLTGVIGGSWETLFQLFADQDQVLPVDLSTIYDTSAITLEVDGVATLTPTTGLDVTGADTGTIVATMGPSLTGTAPTSTQWRLRLPRLDAGVDFPLDGQVFWRRP